nr:uncharacterized protein LOC126525226 [Dermacentor andersoni]
MLFREGGQVVKKSDVDDGQKLMVTQYASASAQQQPPRRRSGLPLPSPPVGGAVSHTPAGSLRRAALRSAFLLFLPSRRLLHLFLTRRRAAAAAAAKCSPAALHIAGGHSNRLPPRYIPTRRCCRLLPLAVSRRRLLRPRRLLRSPASCHPSSPTVLCHRTRVEDQQRTSQPVVTEAASMAAAASASASSVARSVLGLLKTVARDVLAVLAVLFFFLTPVAALPYTRAYVPNTYTLINSHCSAWALRILTWLLLLPGTVSVVLVLIVLPPLCIPRRWKYRAVIENYKVGPQTTFRWESPFFDRKYRL